VSEVDPAELSSTPGRVAAESFDEAADVPSSGSSSKKPEREGLPPGYRMRADAHYVDLITSRRAERGPAEVVRPSRRPDRDRAQDGSSDLAERADARQRGERVLTALGEDLATIEAAAAVLASDASRMARRANVDIIRAQAWRAAWLLRANSVMEGVHRGAVRPRSLASTLGQIRAGFLPECRLNAITLHVSASDWNAVVPIDEAGLLVGLTGAIIATLGLLDQAEDSEIRVHAMTSEHELRAVEITQKDLAIAPDAGGRFFDQHWIDRPGGWAAALGATVARQVAQQQGGDAIFLVSDHVGSTLRMNFSRRAEKS
jgi:hypothetical protein